LGTGPLVRDVEPQSDDRERLAVLIDDEPQILA
jgi:hypothetical protein